MVSSIIDDSMFSLFIDDSNEYLEKIPDALLLIEENNSKEPINEVFRAVHSIKGAAGVFEFNVLAEICHVFETLLDKVRSGKVEIRKDMIGFLFDGYELLSKILEQIKVSRQDINRGKIKEFSGMSLEDFEKRADNFMKSKPVDKEKIDEAKEVKVKRDNETEISEETNNNESKLNELSTGDCIYKIKIILNDDESMKKARIFIVYSCLTNYGKILSSYPEIEILTDEEDVRDIENYAIYYLDSSENIDILKSVLEQSSVKSFEIEKQNEPEKTDNKKNITEEVDEELKKSDSESISKNGKVKEYIKVEKEKLDNLFNIVGELFIKKSEYNQLKERLEDIQLEIASKGIESKNLLNVLDSFGMINKVQDRQLNDLQTVSSSLRMVPIKECFSKFKRALRKLNEDLGKEVELEIYGEDTDIDKMIAEKISDPLLHMIRNSMDHGIETLEERIKSGKNGNGRIILRAFNSGNNIVIKVEDDGKGIDCNKIAASAVKKGFIKQEESNGMNDEEKLNLIFIPGFSTTEQVTNISGRGVGMDVVKRNIESIKGKIEIETTIGKGTSFTIKLPLTLAIIRALLIKSAGNIYAFPSDFVVTIEKVDNVNIEMINNKEVLKYRNSVLPIIDLGKVFNMQAEKRDNEFTRVVIVKRNKEMYGFKVDQFLSQQHIVVKEIEGRYHKGNEIIGAAILGDGKICMVIDINLLVERYRRTIESEEKGEKI